MDLSGPKPFADPLVTWSNLAIALAVDPPPDEVSSMATLNWTLLSG